MATTCSLSDLPPEVLRDHLVPHLDYGELLRLHGTSRKLREAMTRLGADVWQAAERRDLAQRIAQGPHDVLRPAAGVRSLGIMGASAIFTRPVGLGRRVATDGGEALRPLREQWWVDLAELRISRHLVDDDGVGVRSGLWPGRPLLVPETTRWGEPRITAAAPNGRWFEAWGPDGLYLTAAGGAAPPTLLCPAAAVTEVGGAEARPSTWSVDSHLLCVPYRAAPGHRVRVVAPAAPAVPRLDVAGSFAAFSPDGSRLLTYAAVGDSGSRWPGTVWDTATGAARWRLPHGVPGWEGLGWNKLRVDGWPVSRAHPEGVPGAFLHVADWQATGATLLVLGHETLVAVRPDGQVRTLMTHPSGEPLQLCCAPQGSLVLAQSGRVLRVVSAEPGGAVAGVDAVRTTLSLNWDSRCVWAPTAVAFVAWSGTWSRPSPAGRHREEGRCAVHHVGDAGIQTVVVELEADRVCFADEDRIVEAQFTPSGDHLALLTSSAGVAVVDARTGDVCFVGPPRHTRRGSSTARGLAWSAHGEHLLGAHGLLSFARAYSPGAPPAASALSDTWRNLCASAAHDVLGSPLGLGVGFLGVGSALAGLAEWLPPPASNWARRGALACGLGCVLAMSWNFEGVILTIGGLVAKPPLQIFRALRGEAGPLCPVMT